MILSTFFIRILFVKPIIEFCSWIIVLIFKLAAASKAEALGYPPKPTTISGLNFFITFFAFPIDLTNNKAAWAFFKGLPVNPLTI